MELSSLLFVEEGRILNRRQITQRTMNSFSVVKEFNVPEYCLVCFLLCLEPRAVDQFFLQKTVKRLDTGIVVTVPFAAHACSHFVCVLSSRIPCFYQREFPGM